MLPAAHPEFGLHVPVHDPRRRFPKADGTQDKPLVRTSLNSRDRMMLVHETSNFHLSARHRQPAAGRRKPSRRTA